MSFLLIDRITEFVPGRAAHATLRIPDDVSDFPPCLVAEAIGQVAGYVAMERADFAARPVAAFAGEVRVHGVASPGAVLELSIEATSLKAAGIRYGGTAQVGGAPLMELRRCTGAMLPMEMFDDPERVRGELAMLRGEGAPERAFPSRTEFEPRIAWGARSARKSICAELEAPESGSFYADHFPRRPVYPATLLLDAKVRIAQELLRDEQASLAEPPILAGISHVKVRNFTPPGGHVHVTAKRLEVPGADGEIAVRVEASASGERVSTVIVQLRESDVANQPR